MKITRGYLKQVIKEELSRMEEVGYVKEEESGAEIIDVSIVINGKKVDVGFSERGGPPTLVGGKDLTPDELSMAMRMAAAAKPPRK